MQSSFRWLEAYMCGSLGTQWSFLPCTYSSRYPGKYWGCNWDIIKKCTILHNGHGGMGAGAIQGDKTAEVSLPARLIQKLLVKRIVTKYFSIIQKLEPHIILGHRGQSTYEEDSKISIYFIWCKGGEVLVYPPYTFPPHGRSRVQVPYTLMILVSRHINWW